MNLRTFSFVLLASALPLLAAAEAAGVTLDKADFLSARRITRRGEAIVGVKLSKSGKAKLRKLNGSSVNREVRSEIAGVAKEFVLREPIRGDGLEMGPYSVSDADKVVSAINHP
jgi:hypothetical protein